MFCYSVVQFSFITRLYLVVRGDSRGDSSEASDGMNEEYESDDTDPEEDDSMDVILAFIAADEEDADEQPVTIRSGRAITRRSEIDF